MTTMAKRSPKPSDLNARASRIQAEGTGQVEVVEKNPHAVELGKLGGVARQRQFASKAARREAARKAANARWEAYRQAKAN
jgi:hypothetical protein